MDRLEKTADTEKTAREVEHGTTGSHVRSIRLPSSFPLMCWRRLGHKPNGMHVYCVLNCLAHPQSPPPPPAPPRCHNRHHHHLTTTPPPLSPSYHHHNQPPPPPLLPTATTITNLSPAPRYHQSPTPPPPHLSTRRAWQRGPCRTCAARASRDQQVRVNHNTFSVPEAKGHT